MLATIALLAAWMLMPADAMAAEACSSGAVKGNVSSRGRIYSVPGQPNYRQIKIKPSEGDRCFASADEAEGAGFRASESSRYGKGS